jgi:prepilin-type N-terminal cleavage/methylation domain-containing protein
MDGQSDRLARLVGEPPIARSSARSALFGRGILNMWLKASESAESGVVGIANASMGIISGKPLAAPIQQKTLPMLHKTNVARRGFTLVEIMIVVAIISLLAMLAVPSFLRSRKRSQATQIVEELRIIDSATDQYAIETNRFSGFGPMLWADVQGYMKKGTRLYTSNCTDILGNVYTIPSVDYSPKVSALTFNALSDVAPASFWSPYQ